MVSLKTGRTGDCSVKGLRIAYPRTLGYARVDDQIATCVDEAARNLEALGAGIIEVDPGFESPLESYRKIWFAGAGVLWEHCDEQRSTSAFRLSRKRWTLIESIAITKRTVLPYDVRCFLVISKPNQPRLTRAHCAHC